MNKTFSHNKTMIHFLLAISMVLYKFLFPNVNKIIMPIAAIDILSSVKTIYATEMLNTISIFTCTVNKLFISIFICLKNIL